jgi:PAS domain S-box-containing protein
MAGKREDPVGEPADKIRVIIDSVKDHAIFMLDCEGRVMTWNAGAREIKGFEAAEVLGTHFSRFYTEDDRARDKPAKLLAEARRHGRIEDEGWRIRKDGSRFWANVIISAIRDETSAHLGFTKVTRDMTERKRHEDEFATRARQQGAIAELSIYAMQTRDLQDVLRKAVQVVSETLGTELSAIFELQPGDDTLVLRAGVGCEEGLVHHATVPAGSGSLAEGALLSRQVVVVEDLRSSAPSFLSDHGVGSGMTGVIHSPADARPYGVFGTYTVGRRSFSKDAVYFLQVVANVVATAIMRDRKELELWNLQKEAHEERLRSARAQEAVHERDIFLSVAAHELRTPLAALQLKLQGVGQLLSKEPAESRRASKVAARIEDARRQTERLSDLVERLLDVSRVASGSIDLQPADVDLGEIVRAVVAELQNHARRVHTLLSVDVSGDARGRWDKHRIEQVLTNLTENALKYGDGKPIEVSVEGHGSDVRVTVTDHGIGISDSDVRRIFGLFERAAPVRHYGGLGLGLYITKQIVEAHGGRIRVSSEVGKGSQFVVELPKRCDALEIAARAEPELRRLA